MPRFCQTLDLKDDPALIVEYKLYHADVWPEIRRSILGAGITAMDIYLFGTRLFMVMEVDADFSFAAKAAADAANPKVQEWEDLMWRYQSPLPGSRPGEKWMPMEHIFTLTSPD